MMCKKLAETVKHHNNIILDPSMSEEQLCIKFCPVLKK